jgi:hypothetical protein
MLLLLAVALGEDCDCHPWRLQGKREQFGYGGVEFHGSDTS